MLTVQDWIDAGYKRFNQVKHIRPYSDFGLQKRVKDSNGTKYFITIFVYPYGDTISFSPDVQFSNNNFTVSITFALHGDTSIQMLEEMVDDFWCMKNFDYYEKYDDYE